MRNVLLYFAVKYKGHWEDVYKALEAKEKVSQEQLDKVSNQKHQFITILDENYPVRLKRIFKPPFVLFYKGDIKKLSYQKGLAVIGSRNSTTKGKDTTYDIVGNLKNFTIISGMAKGVDSFSHLSALENSLSTIAILGSGIDYCYPSENKDLYNSLGKHGLILSEFPKNTSPEKENFKDRNRLISGLSDGVLVVEAKKNSGTMNTVKHALQQNKFVYCVPSNDLSNSGTNSLIKEGAILVESAKDIIENME